MKKQQVLSSIQPRQGHSEVPLGSFHCTLSKIISYMKQPLDLHTLWTVLNKSLNDTYHIVGLRLSNKDQYVRADYR